MVTLRKRNSRARPTCPSTSPPLLCAPIRPHPTARSDCPFPATSPRVPSLPPDATRATPKYGRIHPYLRQGRYLTTTAVAAAPTWGIARFAHDDLPKLSVDKRANNRRGAALKTTVPVQRTSARHDAGWVWRPSLWHL